MQSIPGQLAGARFGLVSEATTLFYKFIQRTMGCIHIAIYLFGVAKEEYQFLIDYSQAARKDYVRLHKEVRVSCPADRVV